MAVQVWIGADLAATTVTIEVTEVEIRPTGEAGWDVIRTLADLARTSTHTDLVQEVHVNHTLAVCADVAPPPLVTRKATAATVSQRRAHTQDDVATAVAVAARTTDVDEIQAASAGSTIVPTTTALPEDAGRKIPPCGTVHQWAIIAALMLWMLLLAPKAVPYSHA